MLDAFCIAAALGPMQGLVVAGARVLYRETRGKVPFPDSLQGFWPLFGCVSVLCFSLLFTWQLFA